MYGPLFILFITILLPLSCFVLLPGLRPNPNEQVVDTSIGEEDYSFSANFTDSYATWFVEAVNQAAEHTPSAAEAAFRKALRSMGDEPSSPTEKKAKQEESSTMLMLRYLMEKDNE